MTDVTDLDNAQLRIVLLGDDDDTPDTLHEYREWLGAMVRPYVDGPLSKKEAKEASELWFHVLNFGDGWKIYRQKSNIELPFEIRSAISGIQETRLIELHMSEDGDRNWLMHASLRLGKISGSLGLKPSDEETDVARRVLAGSYKAGKLNRKFSDRTERAVVRRINTLIEKGMKPVAAAKHCRAEYNRRGKIFSWRTAYRAWEKQAQD